MSSNSKELSFRFKSVSVQFLIYKKNLHVKNVWNIRPLKHRIFVLKDNIDHTKETTNT